MLAVQYRGDLNLRALDLQSDALTPELYPLLPLEAPEHHDKSQSTAAVWTGISQRQEICSGYKGCVSEEIEITQSGFSS